MLGAGPGTPATTSMASACFEACSQLAWDGVSLFLCAGWCDNGPFSAFNPVLSMVSVRTVDHTVGLRLSCLNGIYSHVMAQFHQFFLLLKKDGTGWVRLDRTVALEPAV